MTELLKKSPNMFNSNKIISRAVLFDEKVKALYKHEKRIHED